MTTLTRQDKAIMNEFKDDRFRFFANRDSRGFAVNVADLSDVASVLSDADGKWKVHENAQYPTAPIGIFYTLSNALAFVVSHDWDAVARRNRNGKYSGASGYPNGAAVSR